MALLATPYSVRGVTMPERMPSLVTVDFTPPGADVCTELRSVSSERNTFTPPDELCRRLLTAVREAASRNAKSMDELRATVEEVTVVLRNEGATPEAVLITLKALVNTRSLPVLDPRVPPGYGDQLREQISKWSIEEFFRQTA